MLKRDLDKLCSNMIFTILNTLLSICIFMYALTVAFFFSLEDLILLLPLFPLVFLAVGMWKLEYESKKENVQSCTIRCIRQSLIAELICIYISLASLIALIIYHADGINAVMDCAVIYGVIALGILITAVAISFFVWDLRYSFKNALRVWEGDISSVRISWYSIIVFGVLALLSLLVLSIGSIAIILSGNMFIIISATLSIALFIVCIIFSVQLNGKNEEGILND